MSRICFVGRTRYCEPLDDTSEKKFSALESLGESFVVGFSVDGWPRAFTQHAHFLLLPNLPHSILRQVETLLLVPLLVAWLVLWHQVHILVAQSPYEGFPLTIVKFVCRRLRRPIALVVENHGDFVENFFLQRRVRLPHIYRFLMRHCARIALVNADLARAVSSSTRRQLEQVVPQHLVHQFPAWTNIAPFLCRRGHDEESPSQEILYAGVLVPLKGVHHLVRAFASVAADFPKASMVIAGRPQNIPYARQLQRQVDAFGLGHRVQFLGELTQVSLAERMHQALVLVLPSLSEGLGRVILEAMAAGTLVIGTDVGGIPDLVEDELTGFLVPPGDEDALAGRLRWILDHPDQARQMGLEGAKRAAHFFSFEAYLRGYQQLFAAAESLLHSQGGNSAPACS